MQCQRARKLGPEEILQQMQDISEDESDTSDDDIFDPNGDEDYEPPRAASDSSSDCDAEDTCRLEENWNWNWKNKSCLPRMLDKQDALHDVEAQQEEIEEEDEAEAQEE